ncbi:MAG: ATP-binding cassette domain-containing protein [Ilumatobacteraceae bacterium]
MIEVTALTKRFGKHTAVDDLSFTVTPGRVTGFLGPNGSGKSTTMRCMVGLDHADNGSVLFSGRPYRALRRPIHEVGLLLDAGFVHPARSGRNHLRWLAASNGIPRARVEEVLGLVGLSDVGGRRVKNYSLGMKQRLGLAAALLGDPATVILDEPANGLDPEGIRWIRDMLRFLASEGRAVLVSSHQLSEMSLMAQDLGVSGRGHRIDQCTGDEFGRRNTTTRVRVRSPQVGEIARQVRAAGASVEYVGDSAVSDTVIVSGMAIVEIGELAAEAGAVLHELAELVESLEDAFLSVTAADQEYRSGGAS